MNTREQRITALEELIRHQTGHAARADLGYTLLTPLQQDLYTAVIHNRTYFHLPVEATPPTAQPVIPQPFNPGQELIKHIMVEEDAKVLTAIDAMRIDTWQKLIDSLSPDQLKGVLSKILAWQVDELGVDGDVRFHGYEVHTPSEPSREADLYWGSCGESLIPATDLKIAATTTTVPFDELLKNAQAEASFVLNCDVDTVSAYDGANENADKEETGERYVTASRHLAHAVKDFETYIAGLRWKMRTCCFCKATHKSLAALQEHSALCQKHPAVMKHQAQSAAIGQGNWEVYTGVKLQVCINAVPIDAEFLASKVLLTGYTPGTNREQILGFASCFRINDLTGNLAAMGVFTNAIADPQQHITLLLKLQNDEELTLHTVVVDQIGSVITTSTMQIISEMRGVSTTSFPVKQ